jgi:hypothetical protein
MRNYLPLLLGAVLFPALAGAQSGNPRDDFEDHRFWADLALGGGSITSARPAPSADRDVISGNIDVGLRIHPEWGLGTEFGVIGPTSGCGGRTECNPRRPDFAPNVTRWFLIGEYRPGDRGMQLRVGAGPTWMCYRYYETSTSAWDKLLNALFLGDDGSAKPERSIGCKHLRALGASVSVGYQWQLGEDAPASIGLQLRGEAANFGANSKAGTPAFHHRALMMQVQLSIN